VFQGLVKTIPLLLALSGLAFGQAIAPGCSAISPDAAKRQFEVASVRPAERIQFPFARNAFATTGGPGTKDPVRFTAAHTALTTLIMRAYGIGFADQLKGPSWLGNGSCAGRLRPPDGPDAAQARRRSGQPGRARVILRQGEMLNGQH
jgi:hypothetical protein